MAATMKDIAQKTGLGLATISKYLNGGNVRPQNRKLIDDAVKSLHFVRNEFARSLKTRQSRTVGVVIPELDNTFITTIITGMEDILRKQDYAVIVCDCRSSAALEKEVVSFLVHKQVDGLINMPTDGTGAHLAPALAAGTPIVLVDRLIRPLMGKVSAVVIDNAGAAEQATQSLLEAGHRKIGLILGNKDLYTTEGRRQGYLSALAAFGATPDESMIMYTDYSMQGGYRAMKDLMRRNDRPTAVFVTNYETTVGGLMALNELRFSVPEDVSLVVFDKVNTLEAIFPRLSLITQPLGVIAECAAQRLLSLLSDGERPAHQVVTLSTQFFAGGSIRNLGKTQAE